MSLDDSNLRYCWCGASKSIPDLLDNMADRCAELGTVSLTLEA